MHLTALAVDDSSSALDIIENYAAKTPSLTLLDCFTQPQKALDALGQKHVDVVFIDIEMDDLSGIDFIRIVRDKKLSSVPSFVITSAHEQYALQGYDLNITDYLLKPTPYERFLQSLEKVKKEKQAAQPVSLPQRDYLFLRHSGKVIKLRQPDVLYVQSDGHFVRIYLRARRHPLMASYRITQLEALLPAASFLRIHKRYIINLDHIATMDTTSVNLDHVDPTIPVGGTYRHRILELCNALSA
jgi:DNA-binding LytR/AlgR family response regulator